MRQTYHTRRSADGRYFIDEMHGNIRIHCLVDIGEARETTIGLIPSLQYESDTQYRAGMNVQK